MRRRGLPAYRRLHFRGSLAVAALLLLASSAAFADSLVNLGDYFSKLNLLSGSGGNQGPAVGDKVAGAVFADDPAADGAIRDWYGQQDLQPTAPPSGDVPPQPPVEPDAALAPLGEMLRSQLGDQPPSGQPLPDFYLGAVEAFRRDMLAQGIDIDAMPQVYGRLLTAPPDFVSLPSTGTRPAAPSTPSMSCTVDAVQALTEPVARRLADRLAPFAVGPTAQYWTMAREAALAATKLALMPRVTLPEALVLDRIMGGRYWVSQWHRDVAHTMAGLADIAGMVLVAEAERASGSLQAANQHDPESVLAAYRQVAIVHRELLAELAAWIAALRGQGCEGLAALAAARTAFTFAVGADRAALADRGEHYWDRFDLPSPADDNAVSQWLSYLLSQTDSESLGTVTRPEAEALFSASAVEAAIGPLPPAVEESSAPPVPAPESGAITAATFDAPMFDQDDIPDKVADDAPAEPTDESWDDASSNAAAASGSGGDQKGTWLSVAGLGQWPQPGPAGFWQTDDEEADFVTVFRMDPGDARFEGFGSDATGIGGPWVEMSQAGGATIWRGRVMIALRQPKGACPHWTEGALRIEPAATSIDGVWRGKEVDPANCEETEEPDSGSLHFSRAILASFAPIVPGKFIHLIAAPAAGTAAAQYSAAVEFACDVTGTPVASRQVSSSGGRIVELAGDCRYQLVVDRPGSYDIRIDYLGADGALLHSDHLHADVPPIPGLAG